MGRIFVLSTGIFAFALGIQPVGAADLSGSAAPITIVTGMYGVPGAKHVLDIAERLQYLCGPGAQRCSVFCSDSSFGRYNLGRKPICRVTYRCGAEDVRSVEAWREEPLLIRCSEHRDGQALPSPPMTN